MTFIKLNIPLDVCYGSLSLFTSVLHNVFLLYHVDIFVSVYKIDKASFWIGEAVFLLWNSFNDPLFGWLSDKNYLSKKSKSVEDDNSQIILNRLAALRKNGPLFALSFLAFWISWIYPSVQFVVCLCLYDGFLTMIDLHHNALLADLAVSAKARTKLNSKCSLFSALGSASVFLSYSFWNKEALMTFRLFCTLLALFSLVGFLVSSHLLQRAYQQKKKHDDFALANRAEMVELESESTISNTASLKKYVRQLMKQRNLLWFSLMNLIQVFHCHFNSNFFPLFLENLLGDAISPGFGSFLLGISFVAPHINNLYFLSLCRRFGVYAVIRFLFIIKLLISLVMFIAGPTHLWLLCLFIASNRVFTEGTCRLLNLVISDLVDEDYVLHKRTQAVSALMFGTAALLSKPGQTFAPLIGTWLLSRQTGHDIFATGNEVGAIKLDLSQMDKETAAAHREGCFTILVYIPIVCALVQLFTWSRFTLHGKRLNMVKSIRAGSRYATV